MHLVRLLVKEPHVKAGRALIEALKETDTRAIIVGGAGSLYVDEAQTTKLMDTPEFSELFGPTAKGTSKGQSRNLEDLKASKGINGHSLAHLQILMLKV